MVAILDYSCKYDPAAPNNSYFGVGDAVAGLALTLAVQTFLKPLYIFRLSVRRLGILHIYGLCLVGFMFAVVAAALPSLSIPRTSSLSYPIIWEFFAAAAFLFAYAILALGSTLPITLKDGGFEKFAKNLAQFLSENDEREYVAAANDILANIPKLIKKSQFLENRRTRTSAFFDFTYRRDIREASFAASILGILSDSEVCSAIVNGTPWRLARLFHEIEEKCLASRSARPLIKELARQSIISPASPMRREYGYTGFGQVRILTDAIFGSHFVCKEFRPFQSLHLDPNFDAKTVECFSLAMKTCITSAFKSEHYWDVWFIYDMEDVIRDIMRDRPNSGEQRAYEFDLPLVFAIEKVIMRCQEFLSTSENFEDFYCLDQNARKFAPSQNHIVNACATLVFKYLQEISEDFQGRGGSSWSSAYGIWKLAYPSIGSHPDGANPFQQHLALMLLENTRDNIDGMFPAITKPLLSLVGPYRDNYPTNRKSAAGMFENSFYREMRNFRNVRETRYMQREKLLPVGVTFDEDANQLRFQHHGGPDKVIDLSFIRPPNENWIPDREG